MLKIFQSALIFLFAGCCLGKTTLIPEPKCYYELINMVIEVKARVSEGDHWVETGGKMITRHCKDRDSSCSLHVGKAVELQSATSEQSIAEQAFDEAIVMAHGSCWRRVRQECSHGQCDCLESNCPCAACAQQPDDEMELHFWSDNLPVVKIDQSSSKKPILLSNIDKPDQISQAIRHYLTQYYNNHRIAGHLFGMDNDRYIQIVSLASMDGQTILLIHFDMTGIYKKLEAIADSDAKNDVHTLMRKHLPPPTPQAQPAMP